MTKNDAILNAMLGHPLIKEKYGYAATDGICLVGPSTHNLMVETIRVMIKEVEIRKNSNDVVVKTLLTMLNE